MSRVRVRFILDRFLILVFFLVFFWQTRVNILNTYEVYDYLIPFLYLTDVLFVIIFAIECWLDPGWIYRLVREYRTWLLSIVLLLVVMSTGALLSDHSVGAWYRVIKVIEMSLFSLWVVKYLRRESIKSVLRWLLIGVVPLIILGLVEVLRGETLNLKIIGEWYFSVANPTIAKMQVFGYTFMRPYATFSHPNVFGGVMAIGSLLLIDNLVIRLSAQIVRGIDFILVGVLLFGLVLSFSLSAWIAFLLGILWIGQQKRVEIARVGRNVKIILALILVLVFLMVLMKLFDLAGVDSLSWERRWELNLVAVRAWFDNPFLGVGPNQTVLHIDRYWPIESLPRFVQPIHNVFLLILMESGLLGFLLSVWVFLKTIFECWNRLEISVRLVWIGIGITSLMDHYWWTVQAGQLVLFLTLGMTLARMKLVSKNN